MSQQISQDHQLYKQSVQFAIEGQFKESLEAINKAIELEPYHAPSYRLKARVLNALGQKQQAIELIEKSISLLPTYAPSYDNKGIFLIQMNKLEEAQTCFLKAIELDPKFSLPQTHLGDVFKLQGKFREAEEQYNLALTMDPNDALAMCGLGQFTSAMNILEDPTRNGRYPKPHRIYIDQCLQQINQLKQQADNVKQLALKLNCETPLDFQRYISQVEDFEKTFYIDVSPEKQISTKQQFDAYIDQSKQFKYEVIGNKINSLQTQNQSSFIVSYYLTLRIYFDKLLNTSQQENILKEIQVEQNTIAQLSDNVLNEQFKLEPEVKEKLKNEQFLSFLRQIDLQLEISLSSLLIIDFLEEILYQNQELIPIINQVSIYKDQFGQYGFEQALNTIIHLAKNDQNINIEFRDYLSNIVINILKEDKVKKQKEIDLEKEKEKEINLTLQSNQQKLIEEAKRQKKTACCNIY